MAEYTSTEIVIDVKLDDEGVATRLAQVNKGINELTDSNRELRQEIKKGNDENGENSKKLAEQEARLKTLKAEQSALSGQVAQATQKNRVYGDSLKELSAQLNDMRNRYQSLSAAERESDIGKNMLKDIQELDAKLKGTDASMGLFQRNVGDYANQIGKISGLFGSAGGAATSLVGSLGTVAKGMGAIAATPLIGAVVLIVSLIKKLIDAMKGNEQQMMKVKEIMAAFEPIMLLVQNGLTALADVLVRIVGVAVKGVTSALNGLAKAADWVGRIFGADWGLAEKTEQIKAQAAATIELTKAENAYTLQKRANEMESAKIDRDVAELHAKVADKETYTAAQRKQYLQQAIDLERKKAAEEKRLAEENLRLLEARAAQAANSAEDEDKLVQARVAVINADKNLAQVERSLVTEMQDLNKQIAQEGAAAWAAYTAKIKEAREATKGLLDELRPLAEVKKKNGELAEWATNIIDTVVKADEGFKMMEREVADIDLLAPFKDDVGFMDVFALKFSDNAKTIEGTASALQSSFGSLSSMYQELAKDETKSEAEREAAAKKAKAWSAMQIAANSGVAVAKGVVASMDEPFPANIVALASTMAALLSAIAQAKQLASSFETGGVIGGYKGATMGRDNTFASVRTGEMVLNANQQRQLFDIANGGTRGGGMAAALAQALASMPAPVLDYKEFTAFESRVATISETSKLK